MGTKQGSELILDAASRYQDVDYDRIYEISADGYPNWLDFLNDGQRQLVIFRPHSNVISAVYQLIEGTKQRIPDGTASYQDPASATHPEGIQLIKLTRNMGSDGLTPGNAINIVDQDDLNAYAPGWHSESSAATVLNYAYDERNPYTFWVTPPQPAASQGWVDASVASVPTDLATSSAVISVSDIYYSSLIDYMMFRAHLIDSDNSPIARQRATDHWNLFVSSLDRKDLVIKSLSPNIKGEVVKG